MKRKRKEQRLQNNQKTSSKIAIITCACSLSCVRLFVTRQTINYFKCKWPKCYIGLYTSKMSRSRNKGRPKNCSRSKEIKETWQLNARLYSVLDPATQKNINDEIQIKVEIPTALSNWMKLWAMPYRATQEGRVMVESSDQMWSTGEGKGKPLQYSCLENPMKSMKRVFRCC